jgi:hypothetical protein
MACCCDLKPGLIIVIILLLRMIRSKSNGRRRIGLLSRIVIPYARIHCCHFLAFPVFQINRVQLEKRGF